MALKRATNGQFVIKDEDEAIRALNMMEGLSSEIQDLMKEHGIDELQQDATELKRAVTAWAKDHSVKRIEMPEGHYYGMREDVNKREWFTTKDDIPVNAPSSARSIFAILKKKYPKNYKTLFQRITKRTLDPVALDEAVGEGVIKLEDLRPAYHETYKSAYLRRY